MPCRMQRPVHRGQLLAGVTFDALRSGRLQYIPHMSERRFNVFGRIFFGSPRELAMAAFELIDGTDSRQRSLLSGRKLAGTPSLSVKRT